MDLVTEPILTIVISTYNRVKLLEENLCKLLENRKQSFCVIIGDNASTDDTWKMLQKIPDNRVLCRRNDKNLGISNVLLLANLVKTKYFINLNDRDYIKSEDIEKLCNFLKETNNFDMASLYPHKGVKNGICSSDDFINEYYYANHPGYLVYNTAFFQNNVCKDVVMKYIESNDMVNLYHYTYFQLLYYLKIGYCYPMSLIQQPENRDKNVPQTRKEMFECAYVLPEYHIKSLDSMIEFSKNESYTDYKKVGKLILGTFCFALDKIGQEYFFASIKKDFRKRNHIEGASPWKCFHNVRILTNYVLQKNEISIYGISKDLKKHGMVTMLFMPLRIIKHPIKSIRAIFYKFL